jgi:hypothetical protein
VVVICLSGRGDKDMETYLKKLETENLNHSSKILLMSQKYIK